MIKINNWCDNINLFFNDDNYKNILYNNNNPKL
jgi:hypothetical protein